MAGMRRYPAPTRWRTRVRNRTFLFFGSRIDVDTRLRARERASGIPRSFHPTRTGDGRDLDSDPLNSLDCGDDVIVRTRRSTINRQHRESASDRMSGSVAGSTLLRKARRMDRSRAREARNLERFWMKAGFEAPATRFPDSNPEEKPSDPAD